MADTIREQVVAAFATRMSATRFGRSVDLAVFDDIDTDVIHQYSSVNAIIPIRLEYTESLADVSLLSQRANALLGTAIATATGTDITLGGLCVDIEYAGADFGVRDAGMTKLGLNVQFSIKYRFDTGDPFTNSRGI